MEQQFKSSFIPKKDVSISTSGGPKVGEYVEKGLLDKVAVLLFVLTLIGWGGLFGYKKYVEASITNVEKQIIDARSRVDSSRVDKFRAIGRQMDASQRLLASHVLITPLFVALEEVVLPSVQLHNFEFELLDNGLSVKSNGLAANFAAVELQEEIFQASDSLSNARITDLSLSEETGEIAFLTTFFIPRNVVLYKAIVEPPEVESLPVVENDAVEASSVESDLETQSTEEISESLSSDDEFDSLFDELDSL